MPVCKKCGEFSNCLTVDFCEHCGVKDWMVESLHDKTMREHGERYAQTGNAISPRARKTPDEEFFKKPIVGFVGVVLWAVVVIGMLLGGLWLLIAIVKFIWQHS